MQSHIRRSHLGEKPEKCDWQGKFSKKNKTKMTMTKIKYESKSLVNLALYLPDLTGGQLLTKSRVTLGQLLRIVSCEHR